MNNYESGELNFLDFNTRIPLRLFGLSIASIWTFITYYILLLCWSGLYFELLLPVKWSTFHKQVLLAWSAIYKLSPHRYQIWNNREILNKN